MNFLQNIDWIFILQVVIFFLAIRAFTYLIKLYKRFERARSGQKSVLNETSNFAEKQIVNDTIFAKAVFFLFAIFLLVGLMSIVLVLVEGLGRILELPGQKSSWMNLLVLVSIFGALLIAVPWLFDQLKDAKTLTDFEKLEKYLKLRKILNVTLQFRFANLNKAFLPNTNLSRIDFTGSNFSCADLRVANFNHANLMNTDMEAADLREANLGNANLENAKLS